MLSRAQISFLETRQREWAVAYKDVMNEPAVRKKVIYSQSTLAFYTYPRGRRPGVNLPPRGTIYQVDERDREAAHFMSYYLDEDNIVNLYDPAGDHAPTEGMLSDMSRWMRKPINLLPMRHQIDAYDTWCQTWSAAFLDNSLRAYLPDEIDKYHSRWLSMILVKAFLDRIAFHFEEYRHLRTEFYVYGYHEMDVFRYFFDDRVYRKAVA